MLFKEEDYKNIISKELSDVILRNTEKSDYAEAISLTGISKYTIRDVVYRYNSLTHNNAKGIEAFARIAFRNARKKELQAIHDQEFLKSHMEEMEEEIIYKK